MPDQQDSAQRPRPFAPSAPPFRGPAGVARPAFAPLTPDAARAPAPFIARRAVKPVDEPAAPSTTPATAPVARVAEPQPAAVPAAPLPPNPPRTVAAQVAPTPGGDAHLYGHDPFAARVATSPQRPSRAAPVEGELPEGAAAALEGLPHFGESGGKHVASGDGSETRMSGAVLPEALDPARVLEAVAARVRAGTLTPLALDARCSDAAVVAAVLAALLRDDIQ